MIIFIIYFSYLFSALLHTVWYDSAAVGWNNTYMAACKMICLVFSSPAIWSVIFRSCIFSRPDDDVINGHIKGLLTVRVWLSTGLATDIRSALKSSPSFLNSTSTRVRLKRRWCRSTAVKYPPTRLPDDRLMNGPALSVLEARLLTAARFDATTSRRTVDRLRWMLPADRRSSTGCRRQSTHDAVAELRRNMSDHRSQSDISALAKYKMSTAHVVSCWNTVFFVLKAFRSTNAGVYRQHSVYCLCAGYQIPIKCLSVRLALFLT